MAVWNWLKRKTDDTPASPPMPPIGSPQYLPWVARWHPVSKVRWCAIRALAISQDKIDADARLRRIIREELERLS